MTWNLTASETVILAFAAAILVRGLITGLTIQEAGVATYLIGLIPMRRADERRRS